jgi:asparagine synthase (glutamine-hydrolysing)
MCGIVGIVHRDAGQFVAPHRIEDMCAAIRHRGPDDEGVFAGQGAMLGMRRLSIIDVAGSHQPVFNEDGSKVIVYNGEVYNYRELRPGLMARGHRFTTNGDAETILHLYEDEGPACVERLRGMFAFAIWDANAQTLFLARDRFGIKPLYVVTAPWGLAFASELKALLAAGLTERELDWEALDAFFQLGYIPAPYTPFRDVRKLEPGHWLLWRRHGSPMTRRYWDLPREPIIPPRSAELERHVLDCLDASVEAHLVSDVPVAAFLSGGLDSSAVVASMALQGEVPHAFTARYHGSGAAETDETPLARELTARYGAKLTIVDIEPNLRDIFEPLVWALDEPHADDSAIPTWLLSRAVGSEYKVALTGIGGDELFAGYRRHIGMLFGERYHRLPNVVQRAASAVGDRLREPKDGGLAVSRLKRFLRPELGAGGAPDRFLGYLTRVDDATRRDMFAPAIAAGMNGGTALQHFRDLYRNGGAPTGLRAGLYLDYKTFLPDDILALSDRLAMAHSLEIRVPFVDHVLVEQVFGLPDRVKIGWWRLRMKQLLRRVLRTRLPQAHFGASKRGFVGPTASWLKTELREMLLDELSADRVKRLGYFDPAAVSALTEEHLSGRHNREGILLGLLSFSTWYRMAVEDSVSAQYAKAP